MAGKRDKKLKKRGKKSEPEDKNSSQQDLKPDIKITVLRLAPKVLLSVLFFVYLFSLALKYPLNDPDVWWHLKTGDYILQNMEIPNEDPFSYTTPQPLSNSQIRGLRTQWLGQVIFALAERGGGVAGVAMLRNMLIVLPMLAIFLWLIRKGMNHYAALGIVTLPGVLLTFQLFYAFERPQGFSFLLVILLIMLLERLRGSGARRFDVSMVLMPVLMALWSNLHAGFIVGNIIIIIYFGAEALSFLWHRLRGPTREGPHPVFFVICAISIGASFINPNTYHLFYEYFIGLSSRFLKDFSQTVGGGGKTGWVETVVLEFKPLYYFYSTLHYKWIMFYWIFTGALFLSLFIKYIARRKIDFAELFAAGMIAFFANYYARGLMFSLTVLPFYMGKTALEFKLPPINYKKLFYVVVALMLVLAVGFVTTTYSGGLHIMLRPKVASTWITPWYPVALSNFLEKAQPEGPMYNFYTWGGFMIWRLHPQYKVFIDGRAIDLNISWAADAILKVFPEWRKQLDAYDINFIVIPVVFRESGHIIPLAPALVQEDQWKLVFLESNSAVFVRAVKKNREIISRYNIDKRWIFTEIVNVENLLLMGMPDNPTYHIAKANALFALQKYAEAKAIFQRFPRRGAQQLKALEQMGY
jgi:hypothetical protein